MSKQTNILPDNPQIEVIKSGRTGLFTNYIYKAIPLAFDESMSYYETLCGLLHYLKNVIIPTVNNNADAVAELQTLYEELRVYVDDYFKGLDVQEEINNKLDKMVEDGTLPEIIASYLNSKAIFGFDNVELMKNSINLINGSYAETLGFYTKNDGGSALYKIRTITNDDIVDNKTIIPLNNNTLIAELIIENEIKVKQFGAYGDNVHDDTTAIQSAINYTQEKNGVLLINNGVYKITSPLTITKSFVLKGTYSKGETSESTYLGSEIIQATENTNLINFTTNSIYNMQIKDIRFKGNGGRGLNVDGIFFSEFTFDNIIFNGGFTDALYLDQATIGNISNCVISANNGGINLKHVSGLILINNNFWINSKYGIKFGTVSNCYFLRNWFENNDTVQYPNLLFQAPTNTGDCVFESCGFQNTGKETIKIDYITNITEICRTRYIKFLNCRFQNSYECAILVNNDDGNGNHNSNGSSYSADIEFNNCKFNYIQNYCVKTDYSALHWLFKNCGIFSNFGYGNQLLTNATPNLISTQTENNRGIKVDSQYQFENIRNTDLVLKNSLYLSNNILKWRNNDNTNAYSLLLLKRGNTSNRPTQPEIGTMYFDTTLNKPIWFNQHNQWVDATGTVV